MEIQKYNQSELQKLLLELKQSGGLQAIFFEEELSTIPISSPFRSPNNGITLFLKGRMTVDIDFKEYVMEEGCLAFFPAHSIQHFRQISDGIKVVSMAFSDDYLSRNFLYQKNLNLLNLLYKREAFTLKLTAPQSHRLASIMQALYTLVGEEQNQEYVEERIFHYFNGICLEMLSVITIEDMRKTIGSERKKELFLLFANELQKHVQHERSVEFYASLLFVTPDYLSRVTKSISGLSARQLIENHVVIAAKKLLTETSKSIAEIADELNFSDQSFFGKFFKKNMLVSPNTFRRQIRHNFI